MSVLAVSSDVSGNLVDAFRANLLRRAAEQNAQSRLADLRLSQTIGTARGEASIVDASDPLSDRERDVRLNADSARLSPLDSESVASSLPTVSQPLPPTLTGNVLATDPLRILPGQTLPGPRDTADAVILFLQSTGSILTDQPFVSPPGTSASGSTDALDAALADRQDLAKSLLRPDLHTPLNSQILISAANVSPESVPTPIDVSSSQAVVPALAGTALMLINSGESAFRGHSGTGGRSASVRNSDEPTRRRVNRSQG